MTADTTTTDGSTRIDHPADPEFLHATVVRYEDGPDRCTVSPTDVAGDERLTAWLSVDADLLCSLDAMR